MHILFDLDGTLTDPYHGITKCIRHALNTLGRSAPPSESLRWCIGPPLRQSFVTLLGPSDEHLADIALERYRERFRSVGLFENEPYSNIEAALNRLQCAGHRLAVATSKPTVFAKQIIDHFGLAEFLSTVDGSELDGTRSDKKDLISHILKRDSIVPSDAIMIGDREHDMIGARSNGVAGIGVLWGYGSRDELESAGAFAIIDTPMDLVKTVQEAEQTLRPEGEDTAVQE